MLRPLASGMPRVFGRQDVQSALLLAFGAWLAWVSAYRPSRMPVWGPWEFSWPEYLATAFSALWFLRGLASTTPGERPSIPRRAAFLVGTFMIYAVIQTHYDYMAQHMFFMNRIQHVVMHHIGPFLIACGAAGATIYRGMPEWARRVVASRPARDLYRMMQQPVMATLMFSGMFCFWLIPPVHFVAMIDRRMYDFMNWTMILDGVLFWSLVLDPRPSPPARVSYGARMFMAVVVVLPQVVLGALMAFMPGDIYPSYNICGRVFETIDALRDQHIGGIVMWIPPGMMSAIGLILVLNALRLHEQSLEEAPHETS